MITPAPQDILPEIIRVLRMESQAISDCAQRLQNEAGAEGLRKALGFLQQSLDRGGKIIVTGVGKSGKIGQKIAATLSSTGSIAIFVHPTEGLHGDLGVIRPNDVVLALSYTGNTDEIIRFLPSLKTRGVSVIGLGGNQRSTLASHCDAWIDAQVAAEACPHNLAPTTSTTLALALGDAIAIALMKLRNFDSQSFAENHPGGSLGRKLSLKVEDLMHKGSTVPVVEPDAEMEQIIGVSTEKKLGAVLVAQGSHLLGIITDGDLRRSLKHREKFFQLKATEAMTHHPVTALPEMMAYEALRLMEDRPSQISVLPVVDSEGNWKGILRLHDLVKVF